MITRRDLLLIPEALVRDGVPPEVLPEREGRPDAGASSVPTEVGDEEDESEP